MNLASQLRHLLTFLAGLGGLFLSWQIIAPEEVAAVNEAGAKLIDPLVVIIGAVAAGVARLALTWISNLFRRGAGENGENENGASGGMTLLLMTTCAAAVLGGLPSCTVGEYPISGSVTWRDDSTGAKAGITFYPPRPRVIAEK